MIDWKKPLEINVMDESALPTNGWVKVTKVINDTDDDGLGQTHKCYYRKNTCHWWFNDNGEARMSVDDKEPFALVRNKL